MEELTENAEEPDDGDSKKEEQKLGKLQYKVGMRVQRGYRKREPKAMDGSTRYGRDDFISDRNH